MDDTWKVKQKKRQNAADAEDGAGCSYICEMLSPKNPHTPILYYYYCTVQEWADLTA